MTGRRTGLVTLMEGQQLAEPKSNR